MLRTARATAGGYCYYVLNRANERARLFHERAGYQQFLALIARAQSRLELPILAACQMRNHVHLVVRPEDSADLGRWMHWAFTTHVRWYHAKYETTGRVRQGRFKAFIVQQDHHLLTLMRYVERNALRAKLVEPAEDWEWGSLAWRQTHRPPLALTPSPVSLPSYWLQLTNDAQTAAELAEIRACVNRQRPFGSEEWVAHQVAELGLKSSVTPVGRPPRSRRVPICWQIRNVPTNHQRSFAISASARPCSMK